MQSALHFWLATAWQLDPRPHYLSLHCLLVIIILQLITVNSIVYLDYHKITKAKHDYTTNFENAQNIHNLWPSLCCCNVENKCKKDQIWIRNSERINVTVLLLYAFEKLLV